MNIVCCKECQERHFRCHSTCEKYKRERVELDRLNDEIHRKKAVEEYWTERSKRIEIKYRKRKQERLRGRSSKRSE